MNHGPQGPNVSAEHWRVPLTVNQASYDCGGSIPSRHTMRFVVEMKWPKDWSVFDTYEDYGTASYAAHCVSQEITPHVRIKEDGKIITEYGKHQENSVE